MPPVTKGTTPMFSLAKRINSFGYALSGLGFVLRTQHNAWIHLAATLVVVAAGIVLQITAEDWRWVVLAIALVWVAEALNTAVEHVCNVVQPEFHASVKAAKDVAAGAVLAAATGAAIIGILVFWPHVRF
jgi:diacylglycerol kinase (ATP)